MLNQEKLRLMTRMAIFEESPSGKQALQTGKYFKHDYIRWEIIKTILSVTIGYVFTLAVIVIYRSEELIAEALKLDYQMLLTKLLGVYLVVLVVYVAATVIGCNYKYSKQHRIINRYENSLKKLSAMYKQGDDK